MDTIGRLSDVLLVRSHFGTPGGPYLPFEAASPPLRFNCTLPKGQNRLPPRTLLSSCARKNGIPMCNAQVLPPGAPFSKSRVRRWSCNRAAPLQLNRFNISSTPSDATRRSRASRECMQPERTAPSGAYCLEPTARRTKPPTTAVMPMIGDSGTVCSYAPPVWFKIVSLRV